VEKPDLDQYASSPGHRTYCYAELAVSIPEADKTIAGTHFACTHVWMDRLSWPGRLVKILRWSVPLWIWSLILVRPASTQSNFADVTDNVTTIPNKPNSLINQGQHFYSPNAQMHPIVCMSV